MASDASSFGWRAVSNNIPTGMAFNLHKFKYHITVEEILEAKFSLKTFAKVPDAHVKLISDNTTFVDGINNVHSYKSVLCHPIISNTWALVQDKNIWITDSCIPGKENYDADSESR